MVVEAIGQLTELLFHGNPETVGRHSHSPLKSECALMLEVGIQVAVAWRKELLKIYPRDSNGFMQNASQGHF